MKGKFIVFEGHDGVGKTTQIWKLEQYFKSKGQEVIVVRTPGGTEVAEGIRELAVFGEGNTGEVRMALMHAARVHTYENVIRPALRAGKVVLADRWVYSGYLYQVVGDGLNSDRYRRLSEPLIYGNCPEYTIVLTMDESERKVLKQKELLLNGDFPTPQMERAGEAYENRISEAIRNQEHIRYYTHGFVYIDRSEGNLTPDQVFDKIVLNVENFFINRIVDSESDD